VQGGWDPCRNEIKSDHWRKVLKEGCCAREMAWTDVSSTEKMDIKRDLARATVRLLSKKQTVTMGCVGWGMGIEL